ncbi:FkbM family methyltransferase [Leptospira yanagawae]|uniref:FkbM family methyltransferase n=1 Tax=Leptospira yanagawae TaxID=293069 RepID=A0ABY2M089_9LEPT|nr:FkbM family methyltransferase [Leptospira yanagawae]TGL16961.1 FkbM family methyltransferase [Leptospira yanagawae]
MVNEIKLSIIKLLQRALNIIYRILIRVRVGQEFIELVMKNSWNEKIEVNHNEFKLQFSIPNSLNRFRALTFSTKEPETLEWIDSLPKESILWDIGANVGLYSCYAAKARDCNVFAFEPSVFNLELLARNIFLNNVAEKVVILPIPLSDKLSISKLNMTTTEWGGALSTFGKEYGHDGRMLDKRFEYQLFGLSIDEVIKELKIPTPEYIKMDVDGIEQLILAGGKLTLKKIKGIILEINDDFEDQRLNCEKLLLNSGLRFKERRRSEMFDSGIFKNTYNQIWVR